MSVSLNPSSSLGFPRPLTQLVKRTLTISNPNATPIAFKVKTTAPKLYCVRPNSGRVEPGESIEVAVMLQAMKEEPPLSAKCKDKFLIQSTVITPEKETLPLHDIWNVSEGSEDAKVHQQKLKVTYLPQEGQTVIEEEEGQINPPQFEPEPRFDITRPHTLANGHPAGPIPHFGVVEDESLINITVDHEPERLVPTPPPAFNAAHEETPEEPETSRGLGLTGMESHTPPLPSPPSVQTPLPPVHIEVDEPKPDPKPQDDLQTKYNEAQAEIERLRALLAAAPAPPSPSTETTELRRRHQALSDDGESTFGGTEYTTPTVYPEDGPVHVEGVPLQVVAIIALGVFITTYLFF